ncbi:unnamed protein product [Dimorphilus gyrociliatus]|uniref:Uncharacterized protein n=1 Tax=Dimorphilus gyrociliatus TaxID=2664684 RepID=A0A7I8VIJ0_9ANNE|nr:unnamed protein product [Dimorphilus gyrociliatus]
MTSTQFTSNSSNDDINNAEQIGYELIECASVSVQTDYPFPCISIEHQANSDCVPDSFFLRSCPTFNEYDTRPFSYSTNESDELIDEGYNYNTIGEKENEFSQESYRDSTSISHLPDNMLDANDEQLSANRYNNTTKPITKLGMESRQQISTTMFKFKANAKKTSNETSLSESQDKIESLKERSFQDELSTLGLENSIVEDIEKFDDGIVEHSYAIPKFKELPDFSKKIPLRDGLQQKMSESKRSIIPVIDSPFSTDRPRELPPTRESSSHTSSNDLTTTLQTDQIDSEPEDNSIKHGNSLINHNIDAEY